MSEYAFEAVEQAKAAERRIRGDQSRFLRWPWPGIDELVGPMAPGEVHFVAAFSSNGKTTFMASAINAWVMQGRRIWVMPLELRPDYFRTILAGQRLGIRWGDAVNGKLQARDPNRAKQLADEIFRMAIENEENLCVNGVQFVTAKGLKEQIHEAKEFGADVLIVDHIDQIVGKNAGEGYGESVQVCQMALGFAQQLGLTVVFTTQLNNTVASGPDKLAKYGPPQPQHVKMGSHKREIASAMLGLFRPTRGRVQLESVDEYKAKIRAAKSGEVEPHEVLVPNTMGISVMKSRNYGENDGKRTSLRVWNGAVVDTLP